MTQEQAQDVDMTSVEKKGSKPYTKPMDVDGPLTGSALSSSSTSEINNAKNKSASNSIPNMDDKSTTASRSADTASSVKTEKSVPKASVAQPVPLLKGVLSYNSVKHQHRFSGMWNYEVKEDTTGAPTFPPQRFELVRNLTGSSGEVTNIKTSLLENATYHGSFSMVFLATNSKGKRKEKSMVVTERDVVIEFVKEDDRGDQCKIKGIGSNRFGDFELFGHGKWLPEIGGNNTSSSKGEYQVELRKRYLPPPTPSPNKVTTVNKKDKNDKSIMPPAAADPSNLPPQSKFYSTNVVTLRGQLSHAQMNGLGEDSMVYTISGRWSSGLDLLLKEEEESKKDNGHNKENSALTNPFEYKHITSLKSTGASFQWPVSGRYVGWFLLNTAEGMKTRVSEKDTLLKFKPNNQGNWNVDGRGSNGFGKYTITGVLERSTRTITIFRHFQPIKPKSKISSAPPAPAPAPEPLKYTLDDVTINDNNNDVTSSGSPLEPLKPPTNGAYSAVSRGIFKQDAEGNIVCNGKWALTREAFHQHNGTSNFHFGLTASSGGKNATSVNQKQTFPHDSHLYKGSFKLRKGATKYSTIIDQQLVLKFHKNSEGFMNVYGRGYNSLGNFLLRGTLIPQGSTSGQLEVYRIYEGTNATSSTKSEDSKKRGIESVTSSSLNGVSSTVAAPTTSGATTTGLFSNSTLPNPTSTVKSVTSVQPPPNKLPRRESSMRQSRPPSKYDDEDTTSGDHSSGADLRKKLQNILNSLIESDISKWFTFKVDPVALNIPTYHQIITEPMCLTQVKELIFDDNSNATELSDTSVQEFCRLVRLTFKNAMKFNEDAHHPVHASAKYHLASFEKQIKPLGLANIGKSQKKVESTEPVSRAEYDKALEVIRRLQRSQEYLVKRYTVDTSSVSSYYDAKDFVPYSGQTSSSTHQENLASKKRTKKKSSSAPAPAPIPAPAPAPAPALVKLTLPEQEQLTSAINRISEDKLLGVINIIRSSETSLDQDSEEIDLEIDQLSTETQLKLWNFVIGKVRRDKQKPKKKQAGKKNKKNKNSKSVAEKSSSLSQKQDVQQSEEVEESKAADDELFKFDDEVKDEPEVAAKDFGADDEFGNFDPSDNEDDADTGGNSSTQHAWQALASGGPEAEASNNDNSNGHDVTDDAWDNARKNAQLSKKIEEDMAARKSDVIKNANLAAEARLKDAQREADDIITKQAQVEEQEKLNKRKEEEKLAKEAELAREQARLERQKVTCEVNLDEQREFMRQYEGSFFNNNDGGSTGGASPSSEYGF